MSLKDITLGAAGIFQAAELVRQVARENQVDMEAYEATLSSILKIDAPTVADVYGGVCRLKTGLEIIREQLTLEDKQRQRDIARHGVGLMFLERNLQGRRDMQQYIREHIEQAVSQAEYFGSVLHPNVVANLADIYLNSLSTLNYRIHVHGEPAYLQDPDNVNKIRALLLGGVRSAMLWRQKGGGRLQLLWRRRKFSRLAWDFLAECQ